MALPHGRAAFPGIGQILSFSYTLVHGITPGIAQMEVVPQSFPPAERGQLEWTDGATRFLLPDCKIDQINVGPGGGGFTWQVSILDRRWQWAFGQISGHYNLRYGTSELIQNQTGNPDQIVTATEKTPQELARLCLLAMGEQRFDVGDLPNDARPEMHWELENPAQALSELCDLLGCRVVYQLNDVVAIRRVGVGQNLPRGQILVPEAGINPPELPDKITLVTSPIEFQIDFALEAVGLDTDNTVKPINELSYAPTGGWFMSDPEVLEDIQDPEKFPRAAETVFRWYRAVPPGEVLTSINVQSLSQVLPLRNYQVKLDGGTPRQPLAPFVFGVFLSELYDYSQALELTPEPTERMMVRVPFDLDGEQGIVKFSEPIYALQGTQNGDLTFDVTQPTFVIPANIALRCACPYREADTRALRRHQRSRQLNNRGGPSLFSVRDELLPWVAVQYDPRNYRPTGSITNLPETERELDKMLDALLLEYNTQMPLALEYPNFLPIQPDGAIHQVTWSFGPQGCRTHAAAHREIPYLTLSHKQRRQIERLRKKALREERLEQQARRRRRGAVL